VDLSSDLALFSTEFVDSSSVFLRWISLLFEKIVVFAVSSAAAFSDARDANSNGGVLCRSHSAA
jgi:hypothetical protein